MHDWRLFGGTEKAATKCTDAGPPNQGIVAHATVAAGRPLGPHKIAQSAGKEKPMGQQAASGWRGAKLCGFQALETRRSAELRSAPACATLAAGRALGHHKIAQSLNKEKRK
jgi:hypothetical protein